MSASGWQLFSSIALETMQSHFLQHVERPFIESRRRQISHRNLELGRQPDRLFTIDGSEKECMSLDLEKDDNWYLCVCVCIKNQQSLCSHLARGHNKRFWHLFSLRNEVKHLFFSAPCFHYPPFFFWPSDKCVHYIVSWLPNEVSNYEPCYFLQRAGCDRGKEGTQREEEGEKYRENNGFDRQWKSKQKKKWEKENSGVSKHWLQMQPWNNISSTARTIICPSKPAA